MILANNFVIIKYHKTLSLTPFICQVISFHLYCLHVSHSALKYFHWKILFASWKYFMKNNCLQHDCINHKSSYLNSIFGFIGTNFPFLSLNQVVSISLTQWSPDTLKIMWDRGLLSCSFHMLQRLQKSILPNCFKNKDLFWLRAASGRLGGGAVNRKGILPEGMWCTVTSWGALGHGATTPWGMG